MRVSKSGGEKRLEIEFLYLDLDVCIRCKGTDANLETALLTVARYAVSLRVRFWNSRLETQS
jgi:hypothetical protein